MIAAASFAVVTATGMILAGCNEAVAIIARHTLDGSRTIAVSAGIVILETLTLVTIVAGPIAIWLLISWIRRYRPRYSQSHPYLGYADRCYIYASEALENVAHERNVTLVHAASAGGEGR